MQFLLSTRSYSITKYSIDGIKVSIILITHCYRLQPSMKTKNE